MQRGHRVDMQSFEQATAQKASCGVQSLQGLLRVASEQRQLGLAHLAAQCIDTDIELVGVELGGVVVRCWTVDPVLALSPVLWQA